MINNQDRFYQHDQGILNNVFKGKFLTLDPKYNVQCYIQTLEYDLARKIVCMDTEYYSHEIVEEANKNPVFLHFCGTNYDRPGFNKIHPFRKLYEKYSKLAGCEDVIDNNYVLPFKAKLFYTSINNKSILLKLIPYFLIKKTVNKKILNAIENEHKKVKESFLNK